MWATMRPQSAEGRVAPIVCFLSEIAEVAYRQGTSVARTLSVVLHTTATRAARAAWAARMGRNGNARVSSGVSTTGFSAPKSSEI